MSTKAIFAPMFDPGSARVDRTFPSGTTVAAMVADLMPPGARGKKAEAQAQARVALVTEHGSWIVPQHLWAHTRPTPGVTVLVRLIPDGNATRPILTLVVAIAATAIAGPAGAAMAGSMGLSVATGQAVATLGINVLGGLLINALVPPPKPKSRDRRESYSTSGWNNRLEPDGAVPVVLGSLRYAPPFAATSYTEIVGDQQYVRALFVFGFGPVSLSEFRIGDTPIEEFDEVGMEIRTGLATDDPVTLYPRQVVEESVGVELVRPFPRDDFGEIIEDSQPQETPVTRVTGADASGASVIFGFPAGLIRYNSKGDERSTEVQVRVEQRLAGTDVWQLVEDLTFRGKKPEPFFRQYTWDFGVRGRYEIRLTKLDQDETDSKMSEKIQWVGLQTLRPEYPLNTLHPMALVALRIKSTHQLSGTLDDFSAKVTRICPDYDHVSGNWITRATSNPASIYRYALQSPANPRLVPDAGIDLEQLADWHEFCRLKELFYDAVHDEVGATLRDALTEIASAGRATPRHDGLKWGVTIDRPQDLIVDHIHPRNSWSFRARRDYVEPPDGFRVSFLDAQNDNKPAERLVPWPGHVGEINLTEAIETPGKTRAAEVWRETLRHMLVAIHRPDTYEVMQEGSVRVATRGDLVALSHDVLDNVQRAAWVKEVIGSLIVLDELVEIEDGESYAIRFRQFDAADTIGTSIVRSVSAPAGETQTLTLVGPGAVPAAGDVVLFGLSTRVTAQMIVTGVETAQDQTCLIRMVDAAPQIDEVLDATPIPDWDGRIGYEVGDGGAVPSVPQFIHLSSGVSGTGQPGLISYLLSPAPGSVTVGSFEIQHRPVGGAWAVISIPAANGGGTITGYTTGDSVEIRARALRSAGIASDWTAVLTIEVGSGDALIPSALPAPNVSVDVLPGGALVSIETTDDAATTHLQLWLSDSATFDATATPYGAPIEVQPSRFYTHPIGDVTRETLINNGDFATASGWNTGQGWQITGGKATHNTGNLSDLSQALTFTNGRTYSLSASISGATGGTLTPMLTGLLQVTDAAFDGSAGNGVLSAVLTANSTITGFALRASTGFQGSVDNVVLYERTATCLQAGQQYLFIEPLNEDGLSGPLTGPVNFTIT